MKISKSWMRLAYYSNDYATDGVLFLYRNLILGEKYRLIPQNWIPKIDKLFQLKPVQEISKQNKVIRTWACTKTGRYNCGSGYVILDEKYEYLWRAKNIKLYSSELVVKQSQSPVLIFDDTILVGVISPMIVPSEQLENSLFWVDFNSQIGIPNGNLH